MDNLKIKTDIDNYNAWVNGLYVYDALSVCLYNFFGKEKTQPFKSYAEEPYNFNKKPKSKEEREKEERLKVEEQIKERNRKIKEMLNKKNK